MPANQWFFYSPDFIKFRIAFKPLTMKLTGKIIFIAGVVCFMMTYSGCKKHHDEPIPITDQQLDLLSKTAWKVTAVTLDGTDKMSDYSSFTITFSGTKGQATFNYTTAGRTPSPLYPWAKTGTLTFDGTGPATKLTRDDAVPITYAVTATQLTASFLFSGNGYAARVGNVQGAWIFTFGL